MKPTKLLTTQQIKAINNAKSDLKWATDSTREHLQKAYAAADAAFPLADVAAIVDGVNGRATTHTHSAHDVYSAVMDAEEHLAKSGITVANRPGTIVTITSDLPTSRAYKRAAHTAIGSTIVIERRASAWYLISYTKDERYAGPGAAGKVRTKISQAAADDITRCALEGFTIATPAPAPAPMQVTEAA